MSFIKKTYLLLFLLFSGLQSTWAQENAPSIQLAVRAYGDSIAIRWSPENTQSWERGISAGYTLYKTTSLNGTWKSTRMIDTFFPKPEQDWIDLAENNHYAGVAAGLLYGTNNIDYSGPTGALQQFSDNNNKFGFGLFTADVSFEVACHMGLGYVDRDIDSNHTYEYKICFGDDEDCVFSTNLITEAAVIPDLPSIDSLVGKFGDKEVILCWDEANLPSFYSSYDIEVSNDGGLSYEKMNDFPYVFMGGDTEDITEGLMFYQDSLEENQIELSFRVRGRTPFEEFGPYSDLFTGQGTTAASPILPYIMDIDETEEGAFVIEWTINEDYIEDVVGFNIYRSIGDSLAQLNTNLLSPTSRTFTDETPEDLNFYRLEVIDQYGNQILSTLKSVQLGDEIPPSIPTGLTGSIDSLGVVTLNWVANEETDLKGYRVYLSNKEDGEYSILTPKTIAANTFLDTIEAKTLNEKVFYKIRSLDNRGNQSDYSEVAELIRPDLLAPSAPVFSNRSNNSNGIELTWQGSSSRDVIRTELQRISLSDSEQRTSWQIIQEQTPQNKVGKMVYKEQIAERTSANQAKEKFAYRLISYDKNGHQSISDTLFIVPYDDMKRDAISHLKATKKENAVQISWEYLAQASIRRVMVYRSVNGQALRTIAQIKGEDLVFTSTAHVKQYRFLDEYLPADSELEYQLMIKLEDGGITPISEAVKVSY